jgi:hypothetical protein
MIRQHSHSTQVPCAEICNSPDSDALNDNAHTAQQPGHASASSELQRHAALKRHTVESTALSLLASTDTQSQQLYEKLLTCSEQITLRGDRVIHHQRCRHRLCALCQHIDASKRIAETKAALDYLDTPLYDDPLADSDAPKSTALKLTLNAGSTRPLSELRQLLKALHSAWSDLVSRTAIKRHTIGHQRATEITSSSEISGDLRANPHIHGTLLLAVQSDETPDDIEQLVKIEVERLWPQIIKRHLIKQRLKPETISDSAQHIEPLWSRTNDDLYSWLRYSLKGLAPSLTEEIARREMDTPSQLSEVWSTLNHAINGLRLVSRGGELKEMIREHKATERARSCARADRAPDAQPTHRWSYPLAQWIPLLSYDPRRDHNLSAPAETIYSELSAETIRALTERAQDRQKIEITRSDQHATSYYLSTGNMLKYIDNRAYS